MGAQIKTLSFLAYIVRIFQVIRVIIFKNVLKKI